MKRAELENLTMEELHQVALQECGPRFSKRVEGFRRGYRHFLLTVVRRAEGEASSEVKHDSEAEEGECTDVSTAH